MKNILLVTFCVLTADFLFAQRDPLKWPFDKHSIWNIPIHNNAVYVNANVQPADNFEADEDVIVMTPNEPLMNVETNFTDWSAGGDARCSDQGPTLFAAPIPQSFIYSNNTWHGSTPNAGLAVLLPNGKIKQTQPFAKCTPTLATSHYVWNENDCVLTDECIGGAHGGSKLSAIGGALRVGELTAGVIKHVLKINLWGKENFYNGNGGYRWPALGADGGYADANAPNYYGGSNVEMNIGALLALHKDVNLTSLANNSLGLETEPGLIIARALQNYGAYTVDNTAWDAYAIITEHGPNGRVSDEFQSRYGYAMNVYGGLSSSAWRRDVLKLFTNLYVISNNSATNKGGGPTTDTNRRVSFACDLGAQGTGYLCDQTFKVMPLGDSKTEGAFNAGTQHSWRGYLRAKLIQENYKIDYVGDRSQRAHGDVLPYDNDHAGHGGYTIGPDTQTFCTGCETTGIFEHIDQWLPPANPDIVVLSIGINDMFDVAGRPANYKTTAPQRYQDLVNKIIQLKPGVKIIACTVEPVKWSTAFSAAGSDLGNLNDKIRQIANASASDNIFLAEVHDDFMTTYAASDFYDDVHLNQQGAAKVANTIFSALTGVLQGNSLTNKYPSVTITSPANKATYNGTINLTIEATASDTDGTISKVDFYDGATLLGTDNSSPYTYSWSSVPPGPHKLIAQATDNVGAVTSSANTNIVVYVETGNVKFNGTGIGSSGSYNNSGDTFGKALDGSLTTFFDGPTPNGQWVGLDLGAPNVVSEIKYSPRDQWASRMVGGRIQGSQTATFSSPVLLHTILTEPVDGLLTQIILNNTTAYRYIRYLSPNGGYGNISEIEFWGPEQIITGVNDEMIFDQRLKIYPNPLSKGDLHIELHEMSKNSNATIAIYDLAGKKVLQKTIDIDTTGFASTIIQSKELNGNGMFLLTIQTERDFQSRKFIVH
jgi:hypothetical protein